MNKTTAIDKNALGIETVIGGRNYGDATVVMRVTAPDPHVAALLLAAISTPIALAIPGQRRNVAAMARPYVDSDSQVVIEGCTTPQAQACRDALAKAGLIERLSNLLGAL